MKNVLFIHLESLNCQNYRLNQELFPAITEAEKRGTYFSHYYSTATSTLMVIGDLLYGGMEQYEQCSSLDDIPSRYVYPSSLFDDLKSKGYHTGLYIYPNGGDRASAEKRHIAGFRNEMILKPDYKSFIRSLAEGMSKAPFALMACNYISNLALNCYADYGQFGWDMSSWEIGYHLVNDCVRDILGLLKEKNLLDSTMVVLYGDHGDDYWTHGLHIGLTHAIEPNELLVHTPLILINPGKEGRTECDKLLDTTDLRGMVYGMAVDDFPLGQVMPEKKIVISRNEYAAQPIRAESFHKAYSVTDGKYRMLVSTDGLELYDTQMDGGCHNNFLRFFTYDGDLLKEDTEKTSRLSFHFRDYMNSRNQRILRQKFYELRETLYEKTKALYLAGGLTEKRMIEEMNFEVINYGKSLHMGNRDMGT